MTYFRSVNHRLSTNDVLEMTSRLQVKDEQKNHLHIYDLQFWCVLHFVLILVKIWLMVKVSGLLITNLNHPLI